MMGVQVAQCPGEGQLVQDVVLALAGDLPARQDPDQVCKPAGRYEFPGGVSPSAFSFLASSVSESWKSRASEVRMTVVTS